MKKTLALILALTMAFSMIAGCAAAPAPAGEAPAAPAAESAGAAPVTDAVTPKDFTLRVWTFQTFSNETDQRVIDQIQKFSLESGINVVLETVAETTFTSKFTAALEAGALPDILCMRPDHINITYPNVPFLDLTDIIPQIEEATGRKFVESYVKQLTTGGKTYGMPFYTSGQPGIYRTDVWTSGIPATWDETVEMAKAVTQPEIGLFSLGIGCGPTDNDGETALRMWIWSEGGRLFDEQGNPDPVNPGTIKVIQQYVDLYKASVVPESATTWDAGGNNNSYLLEESSLHFNPFTVVNAMKKNDAYSTLLANTSATNIPAGTAGHFTNCGTTGGFAINKDCQHVDAAVELLTYMCQKDWYNEFVSLSAPLNPPVFQDAEELELWKNDPYCKVMIEMGKGESGWFGYPCEAVEGRKAGALVFNNYLLCKAITRIIQEDLTVEAGLEQLKKDMEDLLG